MKTGKTECSERLAYKIQTPGNYPEESIQHSEQGESLKSRIIIKVFSVLSVSSYWHILFVLKVADKSYYDFSQ
jgi:hypothetical protein